MRAGKGARSGQYRATAEPIPGCDNLVSEPLCRVVRVCRRRRQAPKGGWIVTSHIDQRREVDVPYMYMPASI
ncbi:unnamed protein product [Prunus armeniaca]